MDHVSHAGVGRRRSHGAALLVGVLLLLVNAGMLGKVAFGRHGRVVPARQLVFGRRELKWSHWGLLQVRPVKAGRPVARFVRRCVNIIVGVLIVLGVTVFLHVWHAWVDFPFKSTVASPLVITLWRLISLALSFRIVVTCRRTTVVDFIVIINRVDGPLRIRPKIEVGRRIHDADFHRYYFHTIFSKFSRDLTSSVHEMLHHE